MTINNKQSKITPAFSSENAFNNNRSIYLRLLAWLPALFVAAAIFWFSSKPAVESTEMSDSVSRLILLIGTKFGFFRGDPAQYADLIELMSFPVRKAAHMTEYLVFYCTVRFGLRFTHRTSNVKRRLLAALAIVFLYACTDEFHQLFVPGRAGRFTDVLIDCFGVTVVTLICTIKKSSSQR
ncbi:VanZ family protein [Clostridium sp. AF37-5AT]|nr:MULTISPECIES: VanZ family protein [unclassified Clostridium]RHO03643.1 VanZ family protein [Clostridium sp. AM22-16AC]RHO97173.1 VanZ family protein [Clostridium sp. AF37-5AT]